jgi:23S rRNA maturation mini-RNase III
MMNTILGVELRTNMKMKNQYRDPELEAIVGNMIISQYQAHVLKSRIADRLDEWWILSQDRDRNSSSFTFNHHMKKFKVSLKVNEFLFSDKDCS